MNSIAKAWQYDQHIANDALHNHVYHYTHVAAAVTVLPNNSITKLCHILYLAAAETGSAAQGGLATLAPGESVTLCANNADTLTLNCTEAGALTVVAAGTDTYNLKLLPLWL